MATGGFCGQYKPENEYFYRYFRLVNDTGAKPLRKLLENEAAGRGMTVQAFLGTKRQTIRILLQRNKIRQNQFDLIYPIQGTFNLHSLDISLLCFIIKNVCTLTRHGRNATEDLRKARNEICHDSNPEMQISTYNTKFTMLHNVIKILLNECSDQPFEESIVLEMDTVNRDPISAAQTLELIKTFHEHQTAVNVGEMKEKIEDLDNKFDSKLNETTDVLTSEMKTIYARVEKQPIETTDAVKQVLKAHMEEQDTEAKIHPTLEPLRKQTEVILNEVSDFVHTEQFHEAENMLMSTGNVIILGGTGEGKTYTAVEIMRRQGNRKNCLQINCPNDVNLIDPRIVEFVFIDDIFGNNELDESKLKSWIPVLEKLQQLVHANELKLIIASREIVLKECIHSLNKFTMFTRKTVLSSAKLSPAEKLEILSKALEKRNRPCSRDVMQRCVSAFKSDIGFPFMSVLFSSDEQFFREQEHFFKRNLVMNSGILSKLAPCKQMTLLFLWIKGKRFPVVLNRSVENDEILMKLSGILKYEKDIDAIYDEIDTNLRVMDGVFVNISSNGCRFAHNSIYQSTGFYLALKSLYEDVIQYSNLAFFMENVTISESIYRADCVFIRKNHYLSLVNRVISEVIENNNAKEMAVHPCLSRDILNLLIETLKKRKQLKEFLLSGCYDRNYPSYPSSFIAYYIETCSSNSSWFLTQILSHVKCKKHFTQLQKERDCKSYKMQLYALYGACRGGNLAVFKMVQQLVKFEGRVLLDIAGSGNTDMYSHVKSLFRFEETYLNETKALTKAVQKGDIKMYNAIRRYGGSVTTECLYTAAAAKNAELIRIIIHDLSASNKLKVDDYVGYTLSTLFDIDVFETFIQNGIRPSPDNLLASMKGNYKLVESILWDAKYAQKFQKRREQFDPMLKLWSELENNTAWKSLLVEMGILDTYKFLEKNVEMGNVEQVKEVIQHMTRKNDWKSDSGFAINLLNASLLSNDLMFQLLLSYGVMPSASTLNTAVSTGKLDVVKLVVARMKTSGTFDPSNRRTKRAFLQTVFSSSIYEFLASEGLKPNAYHFRFTIECQRENADTLKVVQHIFSFKENESHLNTKEMQSVLLTALYNEDMFKCFMEHGVLLPENALAAISLGGNLEEVKRVIRYLKYQNKWPPSQHTMTRSLRYTFYRPAIFEVLMTGNEAVNNGLPITPYSILFACRKKDYRQVENFISAIQENEAWNPEDIVLKCALLESSEDGSTCEIFKSNGIRTDDILDNAYEIGNTELQSYIIAYLIQKGQNVINFKTLNKYIVSSLSNYPELCSEQLLDRAMDVCENDIVYMITKQLTYSNQNFSNSEAASELLCKSSGRHKLYDMFLKSGFTPTKECLLGVVKHGSLKNFQVTIKTLNMLTLSTDFSRKVLQESLKRSDVRFYTILAAYGLKPQYEDIEFAIKKENYTLCKFLINDIEQIPESGNETVILRVLETNVSLYRQLYEKGIRLSTFQLSLIIDSYLDKKLPFDRVNLVVSDFFRQNSWSFEDPNFKKIYEMFKTDNALRKLIFEPMSLALKNEILEALFLRKSRQLKELLNTDSYDVNECLPDILRQLCLLRKRIDPDCRKILSQRIQANDCSPSLKVLSSVINFGEESTLQIVYSLSEDDKRQLDKCVIQTALEEAIYLKKPGIYLFLLTECNVEPTTYCLLYSMYHQYDSHFDRTLKMLPKSRKTCKDPYYKATLALCCQRADLTRFRALLKFDKFCDTEILYEAVVSGNRIIVDQVKEILMTNGQWDVTFEDYWISSALLESRDDPNLRNFEESDYTVPDDFLSDAEDGYLNPITIYRRSITEGRNGSNGGRNSEHEYEEIIGTIGYIDDESPYSLE